MSGIQINEIFPLDFTIDELEREKIKDDIIVRPPVYILTKEDLIKTPSTNGEILFNLLLKICNAYNYDSKIRSILEDGMSYKYLDDSTSQVSIKVKYIVRLLQYNYIRKYFNKIFTKMSAVGVTGELGTLIYDSPKLDFHKSRRNSTFIIRIRSWD